jgi:DNA-binding GntR family transcriptional regulator
LDDLTVLRTRSLPGVLEKELEKAILGGELAPGGRVNENALAARYGVSRGPIREALRTLQAAGLVVSVPNRGYFVRKVDPEEATHIYEVRAALFGLAGETLARRASDDLIAQLRTRLDAMDEAARARDFDAYYPLNLSFHDFIVEAAGNPVLAAHYRDLVKRLNLFRARSLVQGGGLAVSNAEHRAMVDAVARRDPAFARETFTQHVTRARDRLISAQTNGAAQDKSNT